MASRGWGTVLLFDGDDRGEVTQLCSPRIVGFFLPSRHHDGKDPNS
jgi:hypothetical protein